MPSYNGHKNYNHWNVSLWLNNDEGLYRVAHGLRISCKRLGSEYAARQMLRWLNDQGMYNTPDGVRYTVTTISAAMRDM
jgi:hypothetical protein